MGAKISSIMQEVLIAVHQLQVFRRGSGGKENKAAVLTLSRLERLLLESIINWE